MKFLGYLDIMRYYVNYRDYEKDLLESVQQNSYNLQALFKSYKNSYMKVGRNFEPEKDKEILETVRRFGYAKKSVEELSEEFKINGLAKNGHSTIVASSKFLWLYNKETILMDNNNSTSLGLKSTNYNDYTAEWLLWYERYEEGMINLIDRYFDNMDPIMKEKWFRMRVFDQFLWSFNKAPIYTWIADSKDKK